MRRLYRGEFPCSNRRQQSGRARPVQARGRSPRMARMFGGGTPCAAALALCALASCSKSPETVSSVETGTLPDIVLVSIDSLRPDHLACYGYQAPTSPNIDVIAAAGVRCELALSTTSWTLPAHAALFTGLCDSTHGLVTNGQRLSAQ